jgi:hypothetical protein
MTEVILSERKYTLEMVGETLREAGTLILVFTPMYELFESHTPAWPILCVNYFSVSHPFMLASNWREEEDDHTTSAIPADRCHVCRPDRFRPDTRQERAHFSNQAATEPTTITPVFDFRLARPRTSRRRHVAALAMLHPEHSQPATAFTPDVVPSLRQQPAADPTRRRPGPRSR